MGKSKIHISSIVITGVLIFFSGISTPKILNAQDNTQSNEYFFDLTFLVPNNNENRIEWANLIGNELRKIGINVSAEILGTGGFLNRTWAYPATDDLGLPIFDEGGFDLLFTGISGAIWYEMDFLHYDNYYTTEIRCDPLLTYSWCNIHGFIDSDLDNILKNGSYEYNITKREALFRQAQDIFYDELPTSVIFDLMLTQIVGSSDILSEKESIAFANNILSDQWKNIGDGITDPLIIAQPSGIDVINFSPLAQNILYTRWGDVNPSLIWQGLYERDIDNDMNWAPLIAKSMPKWNNERTVATIDLRNDVYFSDGHLLNAEDVVETYRTVLTPKFNSWSYGAYTNPFIDYDGHEIVYLESNNSIIALDNDTVQFQLTEKAIPTIENSLFSLGILPTHIFGNHTDPVNGTYDFSKLIWENTTTFSIGTGPFKYKEIDLINDIIKFEAVNNYWNGPVKTQEIHFSFEREGPTALSKLKNNTYQILSHDYWISPLDPNVTSATDITVNMIYRGTQQMIEYNLRHPIFGTGVDTPLGKQDPSQARLSAKYIRQAINLAIPRIKIINELQDGFGTTGITPISPHLIGASNHLAPYEYNLTKSMELLAKAGFEIETSDPPPPDDNSGDDGFLILNYRDAFAFLLVLTVLRRINKLNKKAN